MTHVQMPRPIVRGESRVIHVVPKRRDPLPYCRDVNRFQVTPFLSLKDRVALHRSVYPLNTNLLERHRFRPLIERYICPVPSRMDATTARQLVDFLVDYVERLAELERMKAPCQFEEVGPFLSSVSTRNLRRLFSSSDFLRGREDMRAALATLSERSPMSAAQFGRLYEQNREIFDGVSQISLSGLGLTMVPIEVLLCRNTTHLDLGQNDLLVLPPGLAALSELEFLDASQNRLRFVLPNLCRRRSFTADFSNNYLVNLPQGYKCQYNLPLKGRCFDMETDPRHLLKPLLELFKKAMAKQPRIYCWESDKKKFKKIGDFSESLQVFLRKIALICPEISVAKLNRYLIEVCRERKIFMDCSCEETLHKLESALDSQEMTVHDLFRSRPKSHDEEYELLHAYHASHKFLFGSELIPMDLKNEAVRRFLQDRHRAWRTAAVMRRQLT